MWGMASVIILTVIKGQCNYSHNIRSMLPVSYSGIGKIEMKVIELSFRKLIIYQASRFRGKATVTFWWILQIQA